MIIVHVHNQVIEIEQEEQRNGRDVDSVIINTAAHDEDTANALYRDVLKVARDYSGLSYAARDALKNIAARYSTAASNKPTTQAATSRLARSFGRNS